MRKKVFGRQLKRDINERKALFKGLASSFVEFEQIETTEEKAKSVKGYIEKLVTKAKKNQGPHLQSLLQPYLNQKAVVKMINEIAPRFMNRPGGYIRIIKTRQRFSDNAKMVMMEWVEKNTPTQKIKIETSIKEHTQEPKETKKVKKSKAAITKEKTDKASDKMTAKKKIDKKTIKKEKKK